MHSYHCDSCGETVYFQNDQCVSCGHKLGFSPPGLEMIALESAPDASCGELYSVRTRQLYRLCENHVQFQVCNWLIPAQDPNRFCVACRLNEVVPNLSADGNQERWRKLELAKRRALYSISRCGLPTEGSPGDNTPSLRFCFAADDANGPRILTGYDAGRITINVAEADDDERERRRVNLHEPYRTLVGHFRHELGHYYWQRLVANSDFLSGFRELFGDETVDYKKALETYYQQGPPPDWSNRTITAYAQLHPWEDWAETWAHYFHMLDTLETAAAFGVSLRPDHNSVKAISTVDLFRRSQKVSFEDLIGRWLPMTVALNSINRSMGLQDLYPFVIPPPALEKLRFVHDVIDRCSAASRPGKAPPSPKKKALKTLPELQRA